MNSTVMFWAVNVYIGFLEKYCYTLTIYKSANEEEFGYGLQIKSQQELFGKSEKFRSLRDQRKVRFESTNSTSSTQQSRDFSVDLKELYFDATDQLETELTLTPAPAPSTKPSSHIGNCKKVVEEFTNLNEDFSKRLL
ncbi:unnamed protein product [Rhizophagus irregularis]|uniref:Uncharacterized protein n=1 Tax=Rhizophagus irregularis TaxID=588596 RepID=A0A2N1MZ08_9GLOM|nr:hypothetical protein RhiirC2_784265 [Rhizophagus irregularis]CAB4398010.1 unnamed protein product [Rhizophagus irregularis]